jgi:hypothetical protein
MSGQTIGLAPSLRRSRTIALLAGLIGLVGCGIGYATDPTQTLRSYLVGYCFWTGIALGCFPLILIHHLTGGRWGFAVRRPLEAGASTIPLMALLFVPLALGLRAVYGAWAIPSEMAHHAVVLAKKPYLNETFFLQRAAGYFAYWTLLSLWLNWLSRRQDSPQTAAGASRWLGTFSGPALLLHVFAVSFASVDWIMSLEPEWYSTIFGPLWMSGQVLTAFAFMLLVVVPRRDETPRPDLTAPDPLNDLGNLLLAFVMLWAYANLSQFLIIWSGNLPEEIPWYLKRMKGGWEWVGVALIVFQFILPFLVLLHRENKRSPARLARLATFIVVMNLLSTYWLIVPSFTPGRFTLAWQAPFAVVGIGGIWISAFLWLLGRRPSVPGNAPEPVVNHHEGAHAL